MKKNKTQKAKQKRPIDKLFGTYRYQVATINEDKTRCLFQTMQDFLRSTVDPLSADRVGKVRNLATCTGCQQLRSYLAIGMKECVKALKKAGAISLLVIDSEFVGSVLLQVMVGACANQSIPVLLADGLSLSLQSISGAKNNCCFAFRSKQKGKQAKIEGDNLEWNEDLKSKVEAWENSFRRSTIDIFCEDESRLYSSSNSTIEYCNIASQDLLPDGSYRNAMKGASFDVNSQESTQDESKQIPGNTKLGICAKVTDIDESEYYGKKRKRQKEKTSKVDLEGFDWEQEEYAPFKADHLTGNRTETVEGTTTKSELVFGAPSVSSRKKKGNKPMDVLTPAYKKSLVTRTTPKTQTDE